MAEHDSPQQALHRSERALIVSGIASGVFGAVLVVWVIIVPSLAMAAGAILTVSRCIMAVFILLGIRLSRRKTKTFTEGLYKLENIIAVIMGAIILVATYELAKISITHLNGSFITNDPAGALLFFLFAAVLAGVMAWYKLRVAKAENCPSLRADAYFSMADGVAMLILGIALVLDMAGFHRADAIAGLLVSLFLVYAGGTIVVGGLKVLLDASVDRKVLNQVKLVAEAFPDVKKVLSVDGRNSGSFILLHLVLEPAAYDLEEASSVSRDIEARIRDAVPNADKVIVEFGSAPDAMLAAVPVGADHLTIEEDFTTAHSVAMIDGGADSDEDRLSFAPNPALAPASGKGEYLAVFLGRRTTDVLFVRRPIADEDTRYAFEAYGIEVLVRPELSDVDAAERELDRLAAERAVAQPVGVVPEPETG